MVCPVPHERWQGSRVGCEKDASPCAQTHRDLVSYPQTIQGSLRSTHRLARLKPGKFYVCAKRSGECTYLGACLSRGSHRAFPGPQTKHGRRVRPLSLPVIEKRALEERVARTGTAERRVTHPARPYWDNGRLARWTRPYWDNGRPARCESAHLSERRHSKTLSFRISNPRNRLRPQARAVNQPRANKE